MSALPVNTEITGALASLYSAAVSQSSAVIKLAMAIAGDPSVASSTQGAAKQAMKDMEEVLEAYNSFQEHFDVLLEVARTADAQDQDEHD